MAPDRLRARRRRLRLEALSRPREGHGDRPGGPLPERHRLSRDGLAGTAASRPRRGALGPLRRGAVPRGLRLRGLGRARGPGFRGNGGAGEARLPHRTRRAEAALALGALGSLLLPFGSEQPVLHVAFLLPLDVVGPGLVEDPHEPQPRLLQHAARCDVHDHRGRHHAVDAELGEALVDESSRAFGRVSLPPRGPVQAVAELHLGRTRVVRRPEVEPAHEPAGRLLDRGPEAEPGEAGVVVEKRRQDVVLDLGSGCRPPAGHEVHHVRVAVEVDEVVDVVLREPPQQQALGLQEDLHVFRCPPEGAHSGCRAEVLDRRADAGGERRAREGADEVLEQVSLQRFRERKLALVPEHPPGDRRSGGLDRVDDLLHRGRHAREVGDVGALRRRSCRERECAPDVRREVVLRRPSVGDRVACAARRSLHRERRPGGEALVTAWPVHDVGADPDRGDVAVDPVHARRSLVRELEHPVEGRRRRAARLGSGGGIGGVVDGRRAGVREAADPAESRLHRLEDDDRPVHVHAGTALRVGAAERHLQRRKVHDMRDAVLVERAPQRRAIGDVSLDERDPPPLLFG